MDKWRRTHKRHNYRPVGSSRRRSYGNSSSICSGEDHYLFEHSFPPLLEAAQVGDENRDPR